MVVVVKGKEPKDRSNQSVEVFWEEAVIITTANSYYETGALITLLLFHEIATSLPSCRMEAQSLHNVLQQGIS